MSNFKATQIRCEKAKQKKREAARRGKVDGESAAVACWVCQAGGNVLKRPLICFDSQTCVRSFVCVRANWKTKSS